MMSRNQRSSPVIKHRKPSVFIPVPDSDDSFSEPKAAEDQEEMNEIDVEQETKSIHHGSPRKKKVNKYNKNEIQNNSEHREDPENDDRQDDHLADQRNKIKSSRDRSRNDPDEQTNNSYRSKIDPKVISKSRGDYQESDKTRSNPRSIIKRPSSPRKSPNKVQIQESHRTARKIIHNPGNKKPTKLPDMVTKSPEKPASKKTDDSEHLALPDMKKSTNEEEEIIKTKRSASPKRNSARSGTKSDDSRTGIKSSSTKPERSRSPKKNQDLGEDKSQNSNTTTSSSTSTRSKSPRKNNDNTRSVPIETSSRSEETKSSSSGARSRSPRKTIEDRESSKSVDPEKSSQSVAIPTATSTSTSTQSQDVATATSTGTLAASLTPAKSQRSRSPRKSEDSKVKQSLTTDDDKSATKNSSAQDQEENKTRSLINRYASRTKEANENHDKSEELNKINSSPIVANDPSNSGYEEKVKTRGSSSPDDAVAKSSDSKIEVNDSKENRINTEEHTKDPRDNRTSEQIDKKRSKTNTRKTRGTKTEEIQSVDDTTVIFRGEKYSYTIETTNDKISKIILVPVNLS